jgi:hypothetical protein
MTRTVLCLLALCLLPAASAHAASVIGTDPDGVLGGDPLSCPGGCTVAQTRLAGLDQVADVDGVVTGLRIKGSGGTARLRRLTPGPGGATAGAVSAPVTLTGGTVSAALSLPVRAGDLIGVELSPGAQIAADESIFDSNRIVAWEPAPATGETRAATSARLGWVAYQATVEPDADGDGLGDETRDDCVFCEQAPPAGDGGAAPPPAPGPATPPASTPASQPRATTTTDPYAAIRRRGPRVTLARTVQRKGRTVTVTVTNPHAFAVSGKVVLRRGRRALGSAKVKVAAGATRRVRVKVRRLSTRIKKLALAATMKGPVGKPATTKATVRIGKAKTSKPRQRTGGGGGTTPDAPAEAGIDGTYRGQGGGDAGYVMIIEGGVVKSFNGTLGLSCTKSKAIGSHPFSMVADDPAPAVAPDGSFSWEATSGYGFTKLKFTGKVAGGRVTGNVVVEYRPPISGADPLSGMPRMEFDYCFAGRDYTLSR